MNELEAYTYLILPTYLLAGLWKNALKKFTIVTAPIRSNPRIPGLLMMKLRIRINVQFPDF